VSELPSGTVTFLFTDMEGSTRLLQEAGRDRYEELLAVHHQLLTAAFSAHDGQVVDTQGDSFFVAFRTAADAAAAAVDAQRELATHDWPGGAAVKVRMGLHTGEPKLGSDRYVGVGVHKAARIGAAGHGGQVLLSSTTKELTEEELPGGVSIRDLGERRLKDLERPERLFQLVIEGLVSEFAQLNTLDVELRRRRRRTYAGAALIGVVAAAVAVPVFALGQGNSGGEVVSGNAVASIDPASGRVTDQGAVGSRPQAIAYGAGGVWVANLGDGTVSRLDPGTGEQSKTITLGRPVTGLAVGRSGVWAVSVDPTKSGGFNGFLRRIDPGFNSVSKPTRLMAGVWPTTGSLVLSGGSLWFSSDGGLLERVDAAAGKVRTRPVEIGNGPTSLASGAGSLWLADPGANSVVPVDPSTKAVGQPISVGHQPIAIAYGRNAIWVAVEGDDSVARIDPSSDAVSRTIQVGRSPTGIAFGFGFVWVANSRDGTVSRIDPATYQVTTIRVGGSPQRVTVGGGRVWVSVEQPLRVAEGSHVVRVDSEGFSSLDPAFAYDTGSQSILYATCAKLLDYPDRLAPAGERLEPEVAAALPKPTNGGKTYTFTIRKGFRFSPPSNKSVTARTFQYAIERTLSPRMHSAATLFAGDIVGAAAYEAGKANHISGVTARRNALTIELTQAAPDFLARIALPYFCAVPLDTPVDPMGVPFVPGAGPYYVASYTPGQGAVLKRNPNYDGSRPRKAQEIDYLVGISPSLEMRDIEEGQADFAVGGMPRQARTRLNRLYGPGSPAAKAGRQRYFVNPQLATTWLALNTSRPLFSNARLRRAVNYALDRRALAPIGGFGTSIATPTDQLLPPGMPGFRDVHAYPFTGDLGMAKRLARGSGGNGVLYSCESPECQQWGQVVKANLQAIGIHLEVKTFPNPYGRIQSRHEPFDAVMVGWIADYPDPLDFLDLFDGTTIRAKNNTDWSYFDSPTYNHKLTAAARLSGRRRSQASAALDAYLTRRDPPFAALSNNAEEDFFSGRIGCQVYHPIYGIDLAALCIRRHTG
jgi:YVTN family beta-propeller protein